MKKPSRIFRSLCEEAGWGKDAVNYGRLWGLIEDGMYTPSCILRAALRRLEAIEALHLKSIGKTMTVGMSWYVDKIEHILHDAPKKARETK